MTGKLLMLLAAAIALGAILGRLRLPGGGDRPPRVEAARRCAVCGAYAIEGAPCARDDCPQRA